ncbi:MAG TPA: hypothetical protein VMP08_01810 [Anaerolineae bacterium]|nr:hypothetical protein [Anaerolineae bacterium]
MLIALILLISCLDPNAFPLVLIIWIVMTAYPLALIIWIRARTGLLWHSLNAQAVWLGLVFILLVLLVTLMEIVVPTLQGDPLAGGGSNYDVLGLIIVLPLFAFAFRSSTRARAEAERAHYGDHWLSLGALSVADIILLRIPHERA